jgi:predicted amidohydrolase
MKRITFIIIALLIVSATVADAQTAVFTSNFGQGKQGGLPEGWSLQAYYPDNIPHFALAKDSEGAYLSISGNGDEKALAYLSAKTRLEPGTYSYRALFSMSKDVNPQRNLLFRCQASYLDGIFKFYRLDNGMVEGRGTVTVTGDKAVDAEIQVFYRFNRSGKVKLRSLSLVSTEPVQPRWARFACTQGRISREQIPLIAEQAAMDKTDLLLYPECVSQNEGDANDGEALAQTLSELATRHKMYIAASLWVIDRKDGRKYNRGMLFDRYGKQIGEYDKIHPYSPEVNSEGVTSGVKTDIFKTDFGKVGMIICYDSWFTDVTELLSLKGAEVILFPVAGYYRSLIPARCTDNSVRFVISVLGGSYGIFDTAGRDVQNPDRDRSIGGLACGNTFRDVRTFDVNGVGLLCADLNMNCSPSPHFNGGTMSEAPGGKRNRADQLLYLDDQIKKEKERWWENE